MYYRIGNEQKGLIVARPIKGRTVGAEKNVAEWIRQEIESGNWTYSRLAKRMAEVGCPIQTTALYKVVDSDSPRAIRVDELVALAEVLGVSTSELVEGPDKSQARKVRELAVEQSRYMSELEDLGLLFHSSLIKTFTLLAKDPELKDYWSNYSKSDSGLIRDMFDDWIPTYRARGVIDDGSDKSRVMRLLALLFEGIATSAVAEVESRMEEDSHGQE